MAVFDITLWQGAPAAEVRQLFRLSLLCVVNSNATAFVYADAGALVKMQRTSAFCGLQ